MDPRFRSSFIPKKAITAESSKPKRRRSTGLVPIVSGIVFIASLIGAGGVIGYEFILQSRINAKGAELESKRPFGDPVRVAEFKLLDNRLRVAENLVNSHIAFSLLFGHLEEVTLQDVQFNNYSHLFNQEGLVQVELGGITKDYATLVLQSEAFSQSEIVSSATFSDFSLDDRGNVTFKVRAFFDPDAISYRNKLESRGNSFNEES